MEHPIELADVLKELHNISGFRISVHDTDFREIAAYPNELGPFCKLLQQNQEARKICVANDLAAFTKLQESKQVYVYHCKFGLYEAVAPLYNFGTLAGYLMMGQCLDTLSDSPRAVYESASPYVPDKQRLLDAISQVPARTKSQILSCINIMDICAEYITLSHRFVLSKTNLAHDIKIFLTTHYVEKLSIDLLCRHFFCSRGTLLGTFKKKYGVTINQYLTQIRIETATNLLRMTDKPIHEIATLCGFTDQNYFSKVFLHVMHQTPSQYRKDCEG